jgi:hypothetical protein
MTCEGCDEGIACLSQTDCVSSNCFPLTLGSHDLCKSIKLKTGCKCLYAGELKPTDPKYKEDDMETVVCLPESGGCGWCRPLNYWNKKLGLNLTNNWDCGTNTTKEALNVVKIDSQTQGGVLCCQDGEN